MSNALKGAGNQQKATTGNSTSPEELTKGEGKGQPQDAILHEEIKELPTHTENADDLSLEKIVEFFPKRVKTRARLIGGYLQNGEKPLTWTKTGELIHEQQPIPGTSIQDLLYDTTCPKRKYLPAGANIFYKLLRENNIPQGLIVNANRRKLMKLSRHRAKLPQNKRKYIGNKNWLHY